MVECNVRLRSITCTYIVAGSVCCNGLEQVYFPLSANWTFSTFRPNVVRTMQFSLSVVIHSRALFFHTVCSIPINVLFSSHVTSSIDSTDSVVQVKSIVPSVRIKMCASPEKLIFGTEKKVFRFGWA